MLGCLRRWLGPSRTWWWWPIKRLRASAEFLRHCQSMSKPIVVRHQTAQGRVPVPARRHRGGPARSGGPRQWSAARLPSPTAVLDDPATQWIPYRATGSDGSTAMVELASGVALWYHGGPPRLPIRWVVIRYLEERRGPYALLCTDTAAEPLRILQWYLLRWQVEADPVSRLRGPPEHGNRHHQLRPAIKGGGKTYHRGVDALDIAPFDGGRVQRWLRRSCLNTVAPWLRSPR